MKSLILLIPLLGGCAGFNQSGMSAEQLKAAAGDKSVSAQCVTFDGVWGKGKGIFVQMDKSVIANGDVSVTEQCTVSMSNASTAKAPAAGTILVPGPTPGTFIVVPK